MSLLSPTDLAEMVRTAEASFNDLCTILHYTGITTNEYNDETRTYETLEEIPCGFLTQQEMQNERGQVVTIDADALLRLSLTQEISIRDVVICRGMRFEVDGVVAGRTVQIVSLKQIGVEE